MKALKGTSVVALIVALFFTPYWAVAQCYTIGCRSFSQSTSTNITLGSHCVSGQPSSNIASCTLTVSAGDLITVGSEGRAGTAFTVTDSASQTYTSVYFATDSANPSISGIEYVANSAAGSITITSDASVSSAHSVIFAQAWHNAATVSPLDSTFSSGFNFTSTSGTVATGNCSNATNTSPRTPGNPNTLVLSLGTFDNVTPSVGANFTVIDTESVASTSIMQSWIQTTATSTAGAFVSAADDWSVGCAAFHQ
jgi:hypothetical protein